MKSKIKDKLIAGVLFGLFVSSSLFAAPAVEELVKKSNIASYYQGDDGKASVHMVITDKQGRERIRDFVILRKDVQDGGDQYFYVYFKSPSDVRKMVFMVHKKSAGDDNRWLYLPALDLVKRISAKDKRTSFAGSDFVYEDVSGRSLSEDTHELLAETDQEYVLKCTPKEPQSAEFSYFKIYINKANSLASKAEYFDQNNKIYRTIEALEIKDIQGIPTVVKTLVKNLRTGGQTVLTFNDIQYNLGLSADIFTERYLRSVPSQIRG